MSKRRADKQTDQSVRCWGDNGYGCDAILPAMTDEAMAKHDWGWTWQPDCGAASGMGPYFACPLHREKEPQS